ncbi:hypothetical protein [Xenorhabdus sp. KK7.4]|uniref:hypothetical protein n=1 Tax=Xenorhabdus sp. KK7.4 TaxID=1851572 RepID=UPI000C053112|nr:hypothetical protein [Xenorhabdus sp. KK7.4]PHM49088.1 hypothetical protein Xekk_04369 [Xenorhabdus sp. KK7.4]
MEIMKSKHVVIMYRTANQVSRVSNELAGSYMYFARAQNAMDTGLFCQKLILDYWDGDEKFDFLEKRFEIKSRCDLTQDEIGIAC